MFRGFHQFEEDPFFRDHHARMRDSFSRFDSLHGFPSFPEPFALDGPRHQNERNQAPRDLAPRDMFGGMFAQMNSMFSNMDQQFARTASDPNCYAYSQSSVMSYSNDGRGEPKYYQAHTSTKNAPGGIRETQRSVRDSESGLDKMAVGHHIGDRARIVERSVNRKTKEEERKQDFINMDEADEQGFDNEWSHRTQTAVNPIQDRHRQRHTHRALEEPSGSQRDHHSDRHSNRRREYQRDRGDRRQEGLIAEGHRVHADENRGRDREKRVRINSRPVNRHSPREGLE